MSKKENQPQQDLASQRANLINNCINNCLQNNDNVSGTTLVILNDIKSRLNNKYFSPADRAALQAIGMEEESINTHFPANPAQDTIEVSNDPSNPFPSQ